MNIEKFDEFEKVFIISVGDLVCGDYKIVNVTKDRDEAISFVEKAEASGNYDTRIEEFPVGWFDENNVIDKNCEIPRLTYSTLAGYQKEVARVIWDNFVNGGYNK